MELRAVIIYNHELVNIEIRIHVLVSVNSACGRWKSGTGGWVGGSTCIDQRRVCVCVCTVQLVRDCRQCH